MRWDLVLIKLLDWIRENCHNEKIEENFEFLSEKKRKSANL
jgi:hypothetical protein